MTRPTLSSSARGYGWEHEKRRARLLKLAYGKPCECCGEIMLRGTKLHLDHRIPKEVGGTDDLWNLRIVHAECNLIRAGRQFGKRASHPKRSQRW